MTTAHPGVTRIETTRFGLVEVSEEAIIRFPRGLYGLEEARAYCLLSHDERGLFQWLQAADAPAIAMLVTDPFLFFPAYEIEIPDPAAEFLQAGAPSDVTIYTPITVSTDRQEFYANLLGPLVIHRRAGLGLQLIQDATRYSTRHRIGSREPSAITDARAVPADSETQGLLARAAVGTSP
jgi:flagellar assembly factor FliW